MRLTSKSLNDFGSGIDPSDTRCMDGFEMWTVNMVSGETLTESLARLKSLIANGVVDKELGTFAYVWGLNLKTDPSAILLGGDGYVDPSSFMVSNDPNGTVFTTEEEALARINTLVDKHVTDNLPSLNKVMSENSMQMSECSVDDVSDGDSVALFNPFSGKWSFFNYSQATYEAAIADIKQRLLGQGRLVYSVMVKVSDDVDKLFVWVKKSEVEDLLRQDVTV